jgi:hypothetical protein
VQTQQLVQDLGHDDPSPSHRTTKPSQLGYTQRIVALGGRTVGSQRLC